MAIVRAVVRTFAILLAVLVAASPAISTLAPSCCPAVPTAAFNHARHGAQHTPDHPAIADAQHGCCTSPTRASSSDDGLARDDTQPHHERERCPEDHGCDCPITCVCVGKSLVHLPVERTLLIAAATPTMRLSTPHTPANAAHLDRLKRPPRPLTSS
jgi:hypothetical protein